MRILCVLFVLLAAAPASGQSSLEQHIDFLTSDECRGRDVGTEGHDRARDYIAARMKEYGLRPAGTNEYLVPVRVVRSAAPVDEASLKIGSSVLAGGIEYQIADFSDGVVSGLPIFLGYGLSAPQYGWDDFGEHDVRNRTVVAFSGGPPGVEENISEGDRYLLSDGSKAAVAMTRGASAVIFINSPRTHGDGTGQREDSVREIRAQFPLVGIAAARVTERAARRVFGQMNLDIVQYQEKLDFGRPLSIEIPLDISGVLRLERDIVMGHNVIGKLGSGDGPPVVLGAHFDHLGMGGPASLHEGRPRIHPGADDNASGVAVMLEAARRLRTFEPNRPIYFAALTGEERALRGSRTLARVFVDRRPSTEVTFLNLDMVGRLNDQRLRVFADAQTEALQHVFDGATRVRITLDRRPLGEAHSDHVPFAELGFQAIGFSTGRHRDYHRPTDTSDRLDWQGLHSVSEFITAALKELAK